MIGDPEAAPDPVDPGSSLTSVTSPGSGLSPTGTGLGLTGTGSDDIGGGKSNTGAIVGGKLTRVWPDALLMIDGL